MNMKSKISRIKELVEMLNSYRNAYYNEQNSIISDHEYDNLFDELDALEKETKFILVNSPTQSVGYEVKSKLTKIKHSHPMLSLGKTKQISDLKEFASSQPCLLSLKMDGLTISLTYNNGELVKAETRGNGETGEDVTHNAKVFENIPLTIDYLGKLEIDGEAIITYDDFNLINEKLLPEEQYKNPRNLASGSVRQLDSEIAAKRHIRFIAWKVPYIEDIIDGLVDKDNSFLHRLLFIRDLGFDVVPYLSYMNGTYDESHIEDMIESLKTQAETLGYPIDGLVMTYNDIKYGESLGMTGHHPKHSIAFKFYDEEVETQLLSIDWTMGKTGVLTPTAVFEPVEIDGTTVERASLHNVSILESLELSVGDTITVYKANQIIPQVKENISAIERSKQAGIGQMEYVFIPATCPICGGETIIKQDNDSQVLICTNSNCKGKLLGKLSHFVSKNAMNIDGLSESTLEKFISLGYVESFIDIYELNAGFYEDIVKLEGFGKKSANKLVNAIEISRNTTLDRFIYALSIPLIGRTASKTISNYFDGDYDKFMNAWKQGFNFEKLIDFGYNMHSSMRIYGQEHHEMVEELATYMEFKKKEKVDSNVDLSNQVFVITGSLNTFENRDAAKDKIESLGGKVSGSVSKNTSYLVNNDITSTSGKNKKAKELGVPIITEDDLIKMLG